MTALAHLEIYHSRPVAPTRRVALGDARLVFSPPPGFGGILLAGVVAANIGAIDADLVPDVVRLSRDLEAGARIPQPRLRHRFQTDRVGLQRSTVRLHGASDEVRFDFDDVRAAPEQLLLGALYAAGRARPADRPALFGAMRRAIGWVGPLGPSFLASIAGSVTGADGGPAVGDDPVAWALEVLGFDEPTDRGAVRRRFRTLLRRVHPDHGGHAADAATRIAELTEARRILLAGR